MFPTKSSCKLRTTSNLPTWREINHKSVGSVTETSQIARMVHNFRRERRILPRIRNRRTWRKFSQKLPSSRRKWTSMTSRTAWDRAIRSIYLSIARSTSIRTRRHCSLKGNITMTMMTLQAQSTASGVSKPRMMWPWASHSLLSQCQRIIIEEPFTPSQMPRMQNNSSDRRAWRLSRIGLPQWLAGFKTRSMASKLRKSTMNEKQSPSTYITSSACTYWRLTIRRGMRQFPCLVSTFGRKMLRSLMRIRTPFRIERIVRCDRISSVLRRTWRIRTYPCQTNLKALWTTSLWGSEWWMSKAALYKMIIPIYLWRIVPDIVWVPHMRGEEEPWLGRTRKPMD